ncbi:hypothetical protein L9F63_000054, partial [Diploptera punctata]
LALSSSNRLYIWGSSPQVLKLQAQAQKKARLLQQQQSSYTNTPPSPLKSNQVQQDTPTQVTTDTKLASDIVKDSQESSSTYHNPTFVESTDSELPDLNLMPVSNTLNGSQSPSKSRVSPIKKQSFKSEIASHHSLSKNVVTAGNCHKPPADGSINRVIMLNSKRSESSHIPVTVKEAELLETLNYKKCVQSVTSKEDKVDVSSCDSDIPICLKSTSSVFSDLENANVDTKSVGSFHSSSSVKREDHGLNLQDVQLLLRLLTSKSRVKQNFSPFITTSSEGYSIPSLIVSPTMEFKGLTSGRSPVDNYFDVTESKSSNSSVKVEGDDMQPHLMPQLVDTSLVVGSIAQISCGCHHSALVTRDGVLYVWGRNLDGQLGNGTRKEILKPSPLSTPPVTAAAAGSNTKGVSQSLMQKSSSLSGIMTAGDKLRFKHVSCGCEFTVAQENSTAGKVWAWGNNSQAQLGYAPLEDAKPLEGKFVMLKTAKRVIKLPHGSQNSSDIPRDVPGLPSSTITFKYDNTSGIGNWYQNWLGISTEMCVPLCSIEEPCYGLRTLHFAFQHFHGYFDSTYLTNKCLELENYQGSAKLAALDRHYHLALAYQLKALAVASAEKGIDLEKQFDKQSTNLNQEMTEKISNINKDLITGITNIKKATNGSTIHSALNGDETKSTNFSSNSNLNNEAKDRNSNPLILDINEGSQVNGNSNYVDAEKLETNENISSGDKNIKDSKNMLENHEKEISLSKNGDSILMNDEKKILTNANNGEFKISSEEVENKNKRNSEINLISTAIETEHERKIKSRIFREIDTHSGSNGIEEKHLEVGENISEQGKNLVEKTIDENESSSSISTPESLASTNAPDSEMHAFAVQGGTEQMSEGHRYLTSPDSSTSPLASEEPSLLSPEPFLPQIVEKTSPQKPDINLIPVNKNVDIQNKGTSDKDKNIVNTNINKNVDSVVLVPSNKPEISGNGLELINNSLSTPTVEADNRKTVESSDTVICEQNKKYELLENIGDSQRIKENGDSQGVENGDSLMLRSGKNLSEDINKLSDSESVLQAGDRDCKIEISDMELKFKENCPSKNGRNEGIKSVETEVFLTKEINGAVSGKHSSSDRTDLENYENELKDSDKVSCYMKASVVDGSGSKIGKLAEIINSQCTLAEKTGPSTKTGGISSFPSRPVEERIVQQIDSVSKSSTNELSESSQCRDLVAQAAVIVEFYVSVMEEDSHGMMSRLLQQGIEFWLSHSLPVDHLENLLLKHMSKFFYPLGLLLFCKDGSSGEQEMEKEQTATSMLNHLSTRFSLQLCSNLLSHIDQKKAYPEYIELLAQITSIQTSPSLNGCCITGQGLSQSPEQLMEAILEGLGAMKGLGGTYINYQEEVPETYKDSSSEATKLEQLLAFSCGHRYGRSVFHQSVLPELELGLLQMHHPLPNTARVLKGLFDSNSPNLHLACPRCVLSYLQSQTTPPL